MHSLIIQLENRPGALADMGEVLGRAGISIEGGGAFVLPANANDIGLGHFLFHDGLAAKHALESAGVTVLEVREVLVQKLNQDEPGQLGKLTRRMAEANVNIDTLYSDHDHQLILTVRSPEDFERGRAVSTRWEEERRQKEEARRK